jgi:hypothetical protein
MTVLIASGPLLAQVPRHYKVHDEGTSLPSLCSDVGRESPWNSTQTAESHGRLESLGPSEQRIEVRVTGSFNSLMPLWVFIFFLVLRAVNVPNIKKYPFLKRNLFVTVSGGNPAETTVAKTADVRAEGQMAKWNQSLEPLWAFLLSLQING